ncbi:hypothetical protein VTK26DRAFT_1736 [Humicola hyalothermophila]
MQFTIASIFSYHQPAPDRRSQSVNETHAVGRVTTGGRRKPDHRVVGAGRLRRELDVAQRFHGRLVPLARERERRQADPFVVVVDVRGGGGGGEGVREDLVGVRAQPARPRRRVGERREQRKVPREHTRPPILKLAHSNTPIPRIHPPGMSLGLPVPEIDTQPTFG